MHYQLTEIQTAAQVVVTALATSNIVCFTAQMGAGKTTLISEVCKLLQVTDVPTSPTYSIINNYTTTNGATIHHLDLYRLVTLQEAIHTGVEEVIYSGNLCLIEWPQIIHSILPKNYLTVTISYINENTRTLTIE